MWGESAEAYDQCYDSNMRPKHEAGFGQELIAGAASFGAMKIFEDRQRKEGKVVKHGFAKELLAGIAGGEVDKLAQTKGMDEVDRLKQKRRAEEQSQQMYDEHYGNRGTEYDPSMEPSQYHRDRFEYRDSDY